MIFSNIFHALPSFLLATLMIYFIALKAGALPTSGWTIWQHKILPAIALGFGPMALFARLVRGTMLETLQQDYVRTARAKGLRYRRVVGAARAAQLADPGDHGGRPAARLHHHGLVRDRADLQHPGHRPVLRHRGQRRATTRS